MAEFPAQLHAEIEKYEQRHAENPEGRDFVPLANAYRKSGDLELAEGLLRAGLRRYPEYLSAHIVLGRVLADRGAASEAAAEFRHVLSVDPQNLIALRTLGELAVDQGRKDEASYWFGELLAVDPMNDEARAALAAIEPAGAEPSSDFESGTSWWEEPATAEPADPQEQPPAADTSEMESASATLEQALAPDSGADELEEPEGREVLASETLAELYARQGFVDEAADMYRELIRQRGEEPALVRRLAELDGRGSDVPETPAAPAAPPPWLGEDDPAITGSGGESGSAAFADSFADGFPAEEPAALLPPVSGARDNPAGEPREPEFEAAAAETDPAAFGTDDGGAEDEAEGRPISEYFGALLAWRPPAFGSPAPAAPQAADAAAEEGDTEQPLFEIPEAPEAASVVEVPQESEAAAPASDDEPFPWELPAVPEPPPAPPAPSSPPPSPPPSAETEPESPARRPEPFRRAEPAPSAAAEDDDDLESFQAWLRSLKR